MKKIFTTGLLALLLALLLQTGPAQGQGAYSYEQYETVFGRIDQTISHFMDASVLHEKREATPAARQRFAGLFAPGAKLDDDLCAACQSAVVRGKDLDGYIDELLLDYPKGLETVRLVNSTIDYSGLDNGTVQAYLQRSIAAVTAAKKAVTITDLVQLTLKVDWTSQEVKIASVSWLGAGAAPVVAAVTEQKPAPVSAPTPLAAGDPVQLKPASPLSPARLDIVAPPVEVPVLMAPAFAVGSTGPVAVPVPSVAVASVSAPAPVLRREQASIQAPAAIPAPAAPILTTMPAVAVGTAPLPVVPVPVPAAMEPEGVPSPALMLPVAQPMAQLPAPALAPVPVGSTRTLSMVYEPVPTAPVMLTAPVQTPAPVPATAVPVVAESVSTAAPASGQPLTAPSSAPLQEYRNPSVWDDPLHTPHLFAALNLQGGTLSGDPQLSSLFSSYDSRIAAQSRGGKISFRGGSSFGADAQVSFFFGSKAQFGIGTGLLYLRRSAQLQLDEFAVDYRSTDKNGNVFRQRISTRGPVEEQFTAHALSMPLLLKGRFPLNDKFSITADAGLLFNLQVRSDYSTNAAFDYEAFYLFDGNGKAIYDMGDNPSPESWMISRGNYEAHSKEGQTVDDYFASFSGYNVGINKKPAQASGRNTLESVSLGFLVQPGIEYRIGNRLRASAGIYYLSQAFKSSDETKSYRITEAVGSYNSLGGAINSLRLNSVGLSLGLKFALR